MRVRWVGVLLLDNTGKEIGRFEGEDATTAGSRRSLYVCQDCADPQSFRLPGGDEKELFRKAAFLELFDGDDAKAFGHGLHL